MADASLSKAVAGPRARPDVSRALAHAGRRLAEGVSLTGRLAAPRDDAPSTIDLIARGEQVNRLGAVPIRAAEMRETQTRARPRSARPPDTPRHGAPGGVIGGLIMSVMRTIPSVGERVQ